MSIKKYHNFNALDAFRGVAALLVVFYHLELLSSGYVSVDFFFVLSGFILSYRYIYGESQLSKKDFILKRLIRLYPIHLFSLSVLFITLFFLVPHFLITDNKMGQLILQATLTQNLGFEIGNRPYWNYPTWSVSVELWGSILLIYAITQKNWRLCAFASLGIFCILLLNFTTLDLATKNIYSYINSGLLRGVMSLFLGALIYKIHHKIQEKENKHFSQYAYIYQIIFFVLSGWLYYICSISDDYYSFLGPLIFSGLILSFTFEETKFAMMISKIRYLGKISYSVYLNQTLITYLCYTILSDFSFSNAEIVCIIFLILIIYSHLTYTYIEKPSKFYLEKLGEKRLPA